jgi:raffinose/stachyose/melibiose transport system permease protein
MLANKNIAAPPEGAMLSLGQRKASLWRRIWASRTLYLLLAPTMIGAFLFQYYPAVTAFYRSFYYWDGRIANFVGFNNFKFFFTDPRLFQSWINVGQLLVFGVLVVLTVPLLTAYLIFRLRNDRHRYLYRVFFVLPIVVPGFVSIILWRWFYAQNGAINLLLDAVGLDSLRTLWLANSKTALYALMFMGFPWVGGVTMLIYLAGFLAIPSEVVDAARVDGATGFRRLWFVELPLVRGQMKLQVVLTFIGTLQAFQTQLIMTRGGPGWSTMVPGLAMYNAAMIDYEFGYASAIGVVLFVIIFGLTLVNQRYIKGGEEAL